MLAIFLDTQTEIKENYNQCDVLKRRLDLVQQTTEADVLDSHIRAIAGCTHGI